MPKRFQIFVSSTFTDLSDHRSQVIKAILNMGHIPVGMEMFNAADEEQWSVIQREIDQSDYYIVIIGHRYGSTIREEDGISYTEKEYDYAGSIGVPRIGFIVGDAVTVHPDQMESSTTGRRKLEAFKRKVKGKPVDFWNDPNDLGMKVVLSLSKAFASTSRPGWQRATESSEQVLASMSRLTDENAQLREEVARLRTLSDVQVPVLDVFFGSDDASSIKLVQYLLETEIELRSIAASSVDRLQNMVDTLCTMPVNRSYNDGSIASIVNSTRSFGQLPYTFEYSRMIRLIRILQAIGVNIPEGMSKITFENLTQGFVVQAPGQYAPPEAEGGADIQRYRQFKSIEQTANRLVNRVRENQYIRSHIGIRLSIMNRSRLAAEDMTLRIELPDEVGIGQFPLDLKSMREVERGEAYSETIKLLPPHDRIELDEFVLNFAPNTEMIELNVRITGRNLPEPQVIPLRIDIIEPAAAD